MKRLYAVAAIATTFLAFSCQKNMGTGSGEPQEPSSAVPADFKWETTRDLDISVGMPSVTGNTPQYAVIRVYCSPILSDGNIVAMGVVTPSRPVFGTAVTIPAGIGNIYVQTTLPDGTVAVSMEPVAASVNVAGARMKAAAGTPLLRMAGMARAAAEGVGQLLLPAIDSESHERLFGLCRRHPQRCIPMMGLHPTSVNDNPRWRDELALVESYLRTPPEGIAGFCAVGEIGLDLYWSRDFREEQAEAFRRQIDLSLQYGLPIAVHTRDAWPETVAIMREYRGRGVRGVFHAYSDGIETYRKLKECGDFVFGIGGVVTFKKSRLAEVAGEMELRDLVLETDCPYLTPAPHRGERNESAWVRYVCEKVAQIKGLTPEEVAEATTANAERMFGRPQNRPAPSHGRKIFDAPEANRQAAAPPCGGLPATAFRADHRELPPENATEVPENESSDHASPSSDNGLSRPERA